MIVGVDFGITVTDAVCVAQGEVARHASLVRPGPASATVLDAALTALDVEPGQLEAIAVTGGRARELPGEHSGTPVVQVGEPAATARGGLALAGLERALVVSCGTGTAVMDADLSTNAFTHVTGTPVGGGTLAGLGALLLDGADAMKVAELAIAGNAAGVDTTLAEVLGGSLGQLPAGATAVSFGRVSTSKTRPAAADVAAGLTTMVAQTIALITLNAALAHAAEHVVFVGRTAQFVAIERMIAAVFAVYSFPTAPHFPAAAEQATALGAALLAADRLEGQPARLGRRR